MAQFKHRPFNADRFLDKYRGNETVLRAYLSLWEGQIPGLPDPLEIDAFKEFLSTSTEDCRPYAEMLEGLHDAYDLCTQKGEEYLHVAITRNQINRWICFQSLEDAEDSELDFRWTPEGDEPEKPGSPSPLQDD